MWGRRIPVGTGDGGDSRCTQVGTGEGYDSGKTLVGTGVRGDSGRAPAGTGGGGDSGRTPVGTGDGVDSHGRSCVLATPNENLPCSGYLKAVLVSRSVLYLPCLHNLPVSPRRKLYWYILLPTFPPLLFDTTLVPPGDLCV